jgi:hypothetical protein
MDAADVVDKHIQPVARKRRDQRNGAVGGREIGVDRAYAGNVGKLRGGGARTGHHRGALRGEGADDGQPDSPARPGDDDRFAGQSKIHDGP